MDVDISLDQPNRFLDHKVIKGRSIVLAQRSKRLYLSFDNAETWSEIYTSDVPIKNGFIVNENIFLICFGDEENGYNIECINGHGDSVGARQAVNASWHGTQGVGVSDATIVVSEYLNNKNSKSQTHLYVSRDLGQTWARQEFFKSVDFRHIHACFADTYEKNKWIVSTGDFPHQCKWYESSDDAETWAEVELKFCHGELPQEQDIKSLIRATSIHYDEDNYYWATDDILGDDSLYFSKLDRSIGASSRFVSLSKKTKEIKVHCTLGYHARSMIDCDEFYLVITEAKAKVKGTDLKPQIFIIFKDDLSKSHYLGRFDNLTGNISSGSLSRASIKAYKNSFFSYIDQNCTINKRSFAKYYFSLLGKNSYSKAFKEGMIEKGLFISSKGCEIPYRYVSSGKSNAPTLVILHGHGSNERPTKFFRSGWNILAPLDKYGNNRDGCWWLGENGDFFLRDGLQELISECKDKGLIDGELFYYGSSMGGYGAILHGILSGARAVYANVPQIKLLGTSYHAEVQKSNFDMISPTPLFVENDLTNYISKLKNQDLKPVFFICENRYSFDGYLKENSQYFINSCIDNDVSFHYEVLPKSGNDKNLGLNQVVELFDKYIEFK
ncbi:MAG: sialidase family protein [Colwellia sp.]